MTNNMRNLLSICIIFLILCIDLNCSYFIPSRNRIHFGLIPYSDQQGRWCIEDFECGRGFCQAYECHCYRGFITWGSMSVCNYEQRKKLRAFLLSFFVGIFGIDWFYLSRGAPGYIIAGMIKLLISLGCIIGWPILIFNVSKTKRNVLLLGNVINVILSVTSFLWWLTDWIRILANVFYDGQGASLQTWGDDYHYRISYHT